MVKDVLIFESDAFSLTPPLNERGVSYDLPLGDDICEYLKGKLEGKQSDWTVDSEAVREDFGAVLLVYRKKRVFTITTSWQGDNVWAIQFAQMRGCIGWLFDRKPDAEALAVIQEIRLLVDEIVADDVERFKNVKWINNDDFPGVATTFVIPQ